MDSFYNIYVTRRTQQHSSNERQSLLLQRDRATRYISKFVLCITRYDESENRIIDWEEATIIGRDLNRNYGGSERLSKSGRKRKTS